jgi:hypothetical protein
VQCITFITENPPPPPMPSATTKKSRRSKTASEKEKEKEEVQDFDDNYESNSVGEFDLLSFREPQKILGK